MLHVESDGYQYWMPCFVDRHDNAYLPRLAFSHCWNCCRNMSGVNIQEPEDTAAQDSQSVTPARLASMQVHDDEGTNESSCMNDSLLVSESLF